MVCRIPGRSAECFFEDEEQKNAKGVRLTLGEENDLNSGMTITLDETNSKHAIQVLRMKVGDQMHLTDGKGHLITATIVNDHRKHCQVSVDFIEPKEKQGSEVTIAIALTKNASRFEWFLEKAAELGVSRVVPLITRRTETEKFKEERLQNILVSAMLQSQQTWLLQMSAPVDFNKFIATQEHTSATNKYIAHCIETDKQSLKYKSSSSLILIGPEGDFTAEEIEAALNSGYQPVTLGETRLRTETAGMVAATLLRVG
ncbi:RsmE family RNA methyltransferase [Niabella hibiscisoli]|uniref:RsmE family RNA methyltransferase n=1 Tax=Niabella hibiscisoli TaxID=1825928 RepID=UPI001F0F8FEB|nr:RsmE family RNA methyltransferase [Niabella hibiscisoli]MCH5717046.1 16S rRNA (uracil(1498)-N(3))-methyltransferase [Niabella hibiscisoli]